MSLVKDTKLAAIIALLCSRFPKAFFLHEDRRRPLKLGISDDVLAVLGDAIDRKELGSALRVYTGSMVYLKRQTAGTDRIDLDGNACGVVSEEHGANAQRRLTGILAQRRKSAPKRVEPEVKAEPPKPQRLGLADLKAAALRRKAQAVA
jgi:ProP effector